MNSHLTSVRNDKGLLRVGAQEVQQTPWERWTDQLGIGCHRRRHATDTVHTIKLIHRSARSGCEAATSSACLPDHVPLFNGMLLSLAINRLACAAYVYCSKQLLPWFHAHRRSPTSRHAPRCGSGEHFATNEKRSKCTPCKLRCHEGTAPDMRAITGMSFMNPHNCFRVDPATSRPGAALTCERAAQVRFRACGPWLGEARHRHRHRHHLPGHRERGARDRWQRGRLRQHRSQRPCYRRRCRCKKGRPAQLAAVQRGPPPLAGARWRARR